QHWGGVTPSSLALRVPRRDSGAAVCCPPHCRPVVAACQANSAFFPARTSARRRGLLGHAAVGTATIYTHVPHRGPAGDLSPGNPFAREVAAFRTRLLQRVKEGDVDAVADQLIMQARDGDLVAIRMFLLYVIGRPAATVDPDRLDAQELALYKSEAAGFDVFT